MGGNGDGGSGNALSGGTLVGKSLGIAVGVSLSGIIILVSIYFCWRRRRTNKRILGCSDTTETQGPSHALRPGQDLEKHFVS